MKNYECQMIEGCNVHSYGVALPLSYLCKIDELRRAEKRRAAVRKVFFRIFLILLMPIALVLDAAFAIVKMTAKTLVKAFRLLFGKEGFFSSSAASLAQSAGFFFM